MRDIDFIGKTFHFVGGINKITGDVGWRPTHLPNFDPVSPVMVVHDLLEHFPEGTDEVHWEFQALGAALWTRFEGGFLGAFMKAEQGLSQAPFDMLFSHIMEKKLRCKPAPYQGKAVIPLPRTTTEFLLHRVVSTAWERQQDKYSHKYEWSIYGSDSFLHAMRWMRIGYHKAQERYMPRHNRWYYDSNDVSLLFRRLTDAISNISGDIRGTTQEKLTLNFIEFDQVEVSFTRVV